MAGLFLGGPWRYAASGLSRLKGASTAIRALLARDPRRLEAILAGHSPEPPVSAEAARSLRGLDWEALRRQDEEMERSGVQILALGEKGYPDALAELPDPPPVLYLRGDSACLSRPCVAVVGSRLSTTYGQNVAQMLGEDLARAGVTVVSGLARGIDERAHLGSLVVPGAAAAVIATGIDEIYPREHEPLAKRICESGGALLTEAAPGTAPLPRLFPVRNRIIAGLSFGVVVVEATDRSGSLITARLALESGRELFAVPHNITSRTGSGPNCLLQKGARLVQRISDILDEMPPYMKDRLVPATVEGAADSGRSALSPEAEALLRALRPDAPLGVDALASSTGFSAGKLLALLLELQVAGLCEPRPGGRYARLGMVRSRR